MALWLILLISNLAFADVLIDGEIITGKYIRTDARTLKLSKPKYSMEKHLKDKGYIDKKTGKRKYLKTDGTVTDIKPIAEEIR